jgi:hypothetical protein
MCLVNLLHEMGTATVSSTLRREVAEDDVLDATARTSSAAGIDAFAGARAALTHLCATLQLAAVRPLGGLLLAACGCRGGLLSGRRLVTYSSEMKTSIASWRAASRLLLLQESGVGRSAYGASLASTVLVECVILPTNDKCTLPTLEAWDLARWRRGVLSDSPNLWARPRFGFRAPSKPPTPASRGARGSRFCEPWLLVSVAGSARGPGVSKVGTALAVVTCQ